MSVNAELSVMVVEDSAVQRLHALDLLDNLGIKNRLEAENGRHALEVLAVNAKPDIMITDLEMPDRENRFIDL